MKIGRRDDSPEQEKKKVPANWQQGRHGSPVVRQSGRFGDR